MDNATITFSLQYKHLRPFLFVQCALFMKAVVGYPSGQDGTILSLKKKFPKSHIMNPLPTKLVQSRWLNIGLVHFFANLWT